MRFEWDERKNQINLAKHGFDDERKNQINLAKHGFDFADAYLVFNMPMVVELDERENYGEDRYIGIGLLQGRVVVIIYTEHQNTNLKSIYENKTVFGYSIYTSLIKST